VNRNDDTWNPSNMDMIPEHLVACPSDEQLAAYVDGEIDADAAADVATHALYCSECRALIADVLDAAPVPAAPRRLRRLAPALTAAAAAAVVLFFVARPAVVFDAREPVLRVPSELQSEDAPRLAPLAPAEASVLVPDGLDFAWQDAGAGTTYRFTLSDETGTVVWSERTEHASLRVPSEIGAALMSDRTYYWRVEALLPSLATATTPLRSFTMRGR
jgi:hypothetical protein